MKVANRHPVNYSISDARMTTKESITIGYWNINSCLRFIIIII